MNPYSDILKLKKSRDTSAQTAMKTAFLELYNEKPLYAISVKGLCEKAHVARTTFYAYYDTIDTLLAELEDALIVDLLKVNDRQLKTDNLETQNTRFTNNLATFVNSHRSALIALLITQPNPRFISKWKTAVKLHFWDILYSRNDDINSGLILEMIASMAIGAYEYILKEKSMLSQKEINQMIMKALQSLEY